MEITSGKKFEKPQPGNYTGTVIDIVTLPNVSSTFNGVTTIQNKLRVVWTIGPAYPGQAYLTKENKPFEVIGTYNAKLIDKPKKSKLYELLEQMLQGAPPLVKNDEDLERLMIGRSNQLFLVANANPSDPTDPYINIAGVTPLAPGQVAPPIPAGFVRFKNRPKTQAGPQGQPVQTYAQPQAPQTAPQVQPAQVPPASNNVSF
jgi:hypothetical protein